MSTVFRLCYCSYSHHPGKHKHLTKPTILMCSLQILKSEYFTQGMFHLCFKKVLKYSLLMCHESVKLDKYKSRFCLLSSVVTSLCFMIPSQENDVIYYIHTKYFQNMMFYIMAYLLQTFCRVIISTGVTKQKKHMI